MNTQHTDDQLDEQIALLVACIRQCRHEIGCRERDIREMKQQLTALLEMRGSDWVDEHGYARITEEKKELCFNTAALNTLIGNDPLRYGWLKDYRMNLPVPNRIAVR